MTDPLSITIPLATAFFCLDCEHILYLPTGRPVCPKCASRTIVPLATWLKR